MGIPRFRKPHRLATVVDMKNVEVCPNRNGYRCAVDWGDYQITFGQFPAVYDGAALLCGIYSDGNVGKAARPFAVQRLLRVLSSEAGEYHCRRDRNT